MKNSLQNFQYEGHAISFKNMNGKMMWNATQAAKIYGRRTTHFLDTDSTQKLIESIKRRLQANENRQCRYRDIENDDIFIVINGRPDQGGGTYMNEQLYLAFAMWLNSDFHAACLDFILEASRNGYTTNSNRPNQSSEGDMFKDSIDELKRKADIYNGLYDLRVKADKIADEYSDYKKELAEIEGKPSMQEQLQPQEPKPEKQIYVKSYTATRVAKILGIDSPQNLNKMLSCLNVQKNEGGFWQLTPDYADRGYAVTAFHDVSDTHKVPYTKWTGRGISFLRNILTKDFIKDFDEFLDRKDSDGDFRY